MAFNSPQTKRNLIRVLPFGFIWMITGWVFLFVEGAATAFQNLQPDSAITLTIPVFIFASLVVFTVGIIVGVIELIYLERRFRRYSFAVKILYKFLIYIGLMLLVMAIAYPIAAAIESRVSIGSRRLWDRTGAFFTSITFASTAVQVSFSLLLSLLYAAISEHLGANVLWNFFSGKYHRPVVEQRIFMFLDMKDSTMIAERLGHVAYFDLLQEYYITMSDPIIDYHGEVYQYIGDEVVVSWRLSKGIKAARCLDCFFGIVRIMQEKEAFFEKKFDVSPGFRAAMHLGEVTTGEVGALKKEIVFTGDVLNATSRIQGLCAPLNADLLISEQLYRALPTTTAYRFEDKGIQPLKGKSAAIKVYRVFRD